MADVKISNKLREKIMLHSQKIKKKLVLKNKQK